MATTKKTETAEAVETKEADKTSKEYWEEKIPYKIPFDRSSNNEPVFVGVNGKTYRIERNKKVEIPRNVAAIIDQSLEQDYQTFMNAQKAETEFLEKAGKYGV